MLASLHAKNLPGKPCVADGGSTICDAWELRPKVFILEGTPKVEEYAYGKRVIYIDKESYVVPYTDLYDRNMQLWKVLVQNVRANVQPNPNVDFKYEEPQLFVYGYSMIDMQLGHATRASLPGTSYTDEPGWYVNIGPDSEMAVEEDWYSVSSLIATGRGR